MSYQVFLLLGLKREVQSARLQRGVLCLGEPQVGAAAGGRDEESPTADHGPEVQAAKDLSLVGGEEWEIEEGSLDVWRSPV